MNKQHLTTSLNTTQKYCTITPLISKILGKKYKTIYYNQLQWF